jgi:hypothetical protein
MVRQTRVEGTSRRSFADAAQHARRTGRGDHFALAARDCLHEATSLPHTTRLLGPGRSLRRCASPVGRCARAALRTGSRACRRSSAPRRRAARGPLPGERPARSVPRAPRTECRPSGRPPRRAPADGRRAVRDASRGASRWDGADDMVLVRDRGASADWSEWRLAWPRTPLRSRALHRPADPIAGLGEALSSRYADIVGSGHEVLFDPRVSAVRAARRIGAPHAGRGRLPARGRAHRRRVDTAARDCVHRLPALSYPSAMDVRPAATALWCFVAVAVTFHTGIGMTMGLNKFLPAFVGALPAVLSLTSSGWA